MKQKQNEATDAELAAPIQSILKTKPAANDNSAFSCLVADGDVLAAASLTEHS